MRSGFKRIAIRAGLALLGVALFCSYALAPSLVFLPYVTLVPWAVLYMGPRRPRVSALAFSVVSYACWIVCYRSMFRFPWFTPAVMAPFFIPAWLFFPLLARPIQRLELPRSVTLPVVWVAVEWARLLTAPGHFDLFALGYSQARLTPLVQIADVTGVYGISFLVAAVNGLIADAFFALKDAAWRPHILWRERGIAIPAMVIATAFAAVTGYGVLRLETARETPGPRLAIDRDGASARSVGADLVVLSEESTLDDMARLASHQGAMVLFRSQVRVEGQAGRTTNSVFLVDAEGGVRGRYDKQILFPFAEYVPLRRADGPVARGTHMTLFELPWNGGTLPFAAVNGLEMTYLPLVAEAKRRGARFVVNLTGDSDGVGVLAEQMLRVRMLRAIENRTAFVRSGTTGLAAIIDPQGRSRSFGSGVQGEATVPLSPPGSTLYASSRDAFALVCVGISLWLLAKAILGGRPTMTPIPVPAAAGV